MNRPSGLLRIPAIVVAVLVVALALPGGPAAADGHARTFIHFDPAVGE